MFVIHLIRTETRDSDRLKNKVYFEMLRFDCHHITDMLWWNSASILHSEKDSFNKKQFNRQLYVRLKFPNRFNEITCFIFIFYYKKHRLTNYTTVINRFLIILCIVFFIIFMKITSVFFHLCACYNSNKISTIYT